MKKFIHIGYPKNFSTSLQRGFFSVHDELLHLGIGNELAYFDPKVDATFELYLKTAKRFKYQEVEAELTNHFQDIFKRAESTGKKAITLSSEHLSFAFTNDSISFEEKMQRLAGLFGSDANIIVIIRSQAELIKSLYRESVRVGFPGDFKSYMYLLYKYQDRNYYYDMRYDLVYETLCKYFKPENIHFFVFENFRAKTGDLIAENGKLKLIDSLCQILEVGYLKTDFGHFNEALTDRVVGIKSAMNKEHRHDLGNILYDSAEKHRLKHYLRNELHLDEKDEDLYEDVLMKRKLVQTASESNSLPEGFKIDYTLPEELSAPIKKFYEEGNHRLTKMLKIDLPANYFKQNF